MALVACNNDENTPSGDGASSGGVGAVAAGGSGHSGAPGRGGSAGSPAVPTECTGHADCALRATTCCGTCGAPTRDDVIALRVDALDDYSSAVCGPQGAMCPACAALPNRKLFATCAAGVCQVVDLTQSTVTACSSDGDCVVRTPECCECGANMDFLSLVAIAAARRAEFESLVCQPTSACPECAPVYPPNVVAVCWSGHCTALLTEPT
jgi:hypothetical protein